MLVTRYWVGLLGLVVMWGSAFLLINIAVVEIDPLAITSIRVWLGTTLIAATAVLLGKRLPSNGYQLSLIHI